MPALWACNRQGLRAFSASVFAYHKWHILASAIGTKFISGVFENS